MKPCWNRNYLGDWVCTLGTLHKAIVICRTITAERKEAYWRISTRSYLPFTDEQYNKPFNNEEECALCAESIVLEWLKSLITIPDSFTKCKPMVGAELKALNRAYAKQMGIGSDGVL